MSESGKGFIRWDELFKVYESKDAFQFFISKRQAYLIPKRCFEEDLNQITALRALIKNAPIPKEVGKQKSFFKYLRIGIIVYLVLFVLIILILALVPN